MKQPVTLKRFCVEALQSDTSECLVPPHRAKPNGYVHGHLSNDSNARPLYAHRWICEQAHGPAPADRPEAAHSCNNRACVNPRHLRWSSHRANISDRIAHRTVPITVDKIQAIYNAAGKHLSIASRFDVDPSTVSRIKNGKRWGDITGHAAQAAS